MSDSLPASSGTEPVRQRQTRQREAILQALDGAGRPLAVEELFSLAAKIAPRLGLRTVYRNLNELMLEGTLVSLDYPGQPTRYERVSGQHRPHVICQDCGKLFIVENDSPDLTPPQNTPEHLQVTGSEVIFYGRCTRVDCPERSKQQQAEES